MPAAILRTVIETQSAAAEAKLAAYGRNVNSTASKASQALSKFGISSGVAFAAAGAAAVAFVASSVKAYSEHQQALILLQNAIKNSPALVNASTKAFEDQASALQNLTGVQDEEILTADTVLSRFKLTQQQIQQLVPLVLDYAQATGQTATSAAQNLGRAFVGNSRALKTIGIQFKGTGDIGKDFITIMDALKGKVQGASEAFGKTMAGKVAIFKAAVDDAQEAVGLLIVTLGQELITAFSGVGKVLADVTTKFLGLGKVSKEAGGNILNLLSFLPGIPGAIANIGREAVRTADNTKQFAAAAQLAAEREKELADKAADVRRAAKGIRDSVKTTTDAFKDLADGGKITAQELVDAFDKQLADARNWSRNIRTLLSRGLSPEEIQNFIDQMGSDAPAALDALAGASGEQLGRVQDDMKRTQNSAREAGREASGLKKHLDEIPNHVDTHFRVIGADVWAAEIDKVIGSLSQIPRGVTTTFSSPTFRTQHQGGYVFHGGGSVPRFHSGDEVPAILQRGEFVMRRSAVNAVGVNTLRAMNAMTTSGNHAAPMSVTINAGINGDATDIQRELEWWDRTRGW